MIHVCTTRHTYYVYAEMKIVKRFFAECTEVYDLASSTIIARYVSKYILYIPRSKLYSTYMHLVSYETVE